MCINRTKISIPAAIKRQLCLEVSSFLRLTYYHDAADDKSSDFTSGIHSPSLAFDDSVPLEKELQINQQRLPVLKGSCHARLS